MKIAIHIFTIYMLALSLIPCGDGGGGILEIANDLFGIEHQHLSDHEQHSNNCGDDLCTPFCICSCCSSALDTPSKLPYRIKTPTPFPNSTPSWFKNEISFSLDQSIWQPPKFS